MEKTYTANVVGATGLTGSKLVPMLLGDDRFEKVRIFVRRDSGWNHPKLEQVIVDFSQPGLWKAKVTGDILFSALGTTLKQAGSKEKEYEVDFTYNLNFARIAKENGIAIYILISSIGANPRSSLFYTRMKGELDEAVAKLGFQHLAILRPSSLVGERKENRMAEKFSVPILNVITNFILKQYRPIDAALVARAMINVAFNPVPGKIILEAKEVFSLAGN